LTLAATSLGYAAPLEEMLAANPVRCAHDGAWASLDMCHHPGANRLVIVREIELGDGSSSMASDHSAFPELEIETPITTLDAALQARRIAAFGEVAACSASPLSDCPMWQRNFRRRTGNARTGFDKSQRQENSKILI
jgi:hypothetical protein